MLSLTYKPIMLSVVVLNVIMLSVVSPCEQTLGDCSASLEGMGAASILLTCL